MSEHTKLPDIVAAMKWLDAFDSCVYSGPEWAAEHARTIKAEIERLRSLVSDFDANVDRLKACEHIADGDEGWETLVNICPSTAAVGRLRLRSPAPAENIREEALKDALSAISGAPSVGEAEHRIIDLIEKQPPAPADGEEMEKLKHDIASYITIASELATENEGLREAIEAAAKVADETAALEDKHDRYEAWRAAHDIAQTIRSLLPSSGRDGRKP